MHKAGLQPETGQRPEQVTVDETVIRLDDERYWLYVAVDSETNELLHTKLEPTENNAFAHASIHELREKHAVDDASIHELREKHAVDDAVVLVDGATSL